MRNLQRGVACVGVVAVLFLSRASYGATTTLTGVLSGPKENPSNASPGTGFTTVVYDATAHTLSVDVSFSGLLGTTTASHIHCCVAAPGNVGVATTTPTFPGFPLGVTSGTYSHTLDLTQASSFNPAFVTANGGTTAGAEAALANGFAGGTAYLNVHTTVVPGGEIRSFLAAAPAANAAIPSLSLPGLGLLAMLVAGAGMFILRRLS
jgi:hypothetical protein